MFILLTICFMVTFQNGLLYEMNFIDPAYITSQDISSISQNRFPNPTTIITDCTPSVCRNLGNLVQLMIVSNQLLTSNIGSEAAIKLTSPIIKEVLSSPAFTNIVSNPIIQNQIAPNRKYPEYVPAVSSKLIFQDQSLNMNSVYPDYLVQNIPVAQNLVPNTDSIPSNLIYQSPLSPSVVYPDHDSISSNFVLESVPIARNLASPNIETRPQTLVFKNLPVGSEIISTQYPSIPPNVVPVRRSRRPRSNVPNSKPFFKNYHIR